MHERKKLGNFKRRSYITPASAEIITPSLVNLQLSSDAAAVAFDNTESMIYFLVGWIKFEMEYIFTRKINGISITGLAGKVR